jgi:hypothetical protein
METITSRARLKELEFEIEKRRREIDQTFDEEQLLARIGRASEARFAEIADERTLLENALANLLKEEDELTRSASFPKFGE